MAVPSFHLAAPAADFGVDLDDLDLELKLVDAGMVGAGVVCW